MVIQRLIELLSTGPARVLGIPGGTLKAGSVADVTVFHPDEEVTFQAARFRSKGKNTPFDGWTFQKAFIVRFVKPILAGSQVGVQFDELSQEEREKLVKLP